MDPVAPSDSANAPVHIEPFNKMVPFTPSAPDHPSQMSPHPLPVKFFITARMSKQPPESDTNSRPATPTDSNVSSQNPPFVSNSPITTSQHSPLESPLASTSRPVSTHDAAPSPTDSQVFNQRRGSTDYLMSRGRGRSPSIRSSRSRTPYSYPIPSPIDLDSPPPAELSLAQQEIMHLKAHVRSMYEMRRLQNTPGSESSL